MFRPGRYTPQYTHGPSGPSIEVHPGTMNGPRSFPPPLMHGRGPQITPPRFPGGQPQQLGFGPPPTIPPHVSHTLPSRFPTVQMLSASNQGTLSSIPPPGMMPSRPSLEPQHFVGLRRPSSGLPLSRPPPQLPLPPPANFSGPHPQGPADTLPLPPSFSPVPLPPPPPPAMEVSQPPPPSPMQLLPLQPPPTMEVSQPPHSHSLPLHVPPQMSNDVPLYAPPQMPNDEEMIQNIEILSQFVVKNGPEFENMARAKQAGNPKFSFLFDGPPGSDAAIGFQYFQWMKKKWDIQMKTGQELEDQGQSAEPLESPQRSVQRADSTHPSEAVLKSPNVSDMDMDDEFPVAAMSSKDGKDQQSSGPMEAVCKPSDQQETGRVYSKSAPSCIDVGEKEESMPGNVTHMDCLQSDFQDKKGIFQELAYEGPCVEELSPVETSPGKLQQTTNFVEQSVENKGHETSTLIVEAFVESDAMLEKDDLPRNYQEPIPADIGYERMMSTYVDNGTSQHAKLAGKSSRENSANDNENLVIDNDECKEMEAFKPNHDTKYLSESANLKDFDPTVVLDNDVTREPDHEIFDGEEPAKQEKEVVGSIGKERTSDSESDGVLYTGKEIKRGRSCDTSQSPGRKRLRSGSRSSSQQRSRSRSPRRGGDTKGVEERKGRGTVRLCIFFARGYCRNGPSCKFLHEKATIDDAGEWSGDGSGRGRGRKEEQQDGKESVDGFERSVVVEDMVKNTSVGRHSDRHESPHSGKKKSQEAVADDDSSESGERSPAWHENDSSEPHIPNLGRDIIQPPLLHREDFHRLPILRDDFRSQPFPREDFRLQPLPREDLRPRFFQREDVHAPLLSREDVHSLPLIREHTGAPHLLREDVHAQPFLREDLRTRVLLRDDVRGQRFLREGIHTQSLLREDVHAQPFLREDMHTRPLPWENLHTQPLLREDSCTQTMFRERFHGAPLLRHDLRAPLPREEFHSVHPLRKDLLSEPVPRIDPRFLGEDSRSQSLLREDLHIQRSLREDSHLWSREDSQIRAEDLRSREDLQFRAEDLRSREDLQFRAEDLRSREDLCAKLFSKEDMRLQALARDLPSHELHGAVGRFDMFLSGNRSIRQRSDLPVNSSLSSLSDFTSNLDPVRRGHSTNCSLTNHISEHSFVGGRLGSSPESPFTTKTNPFLQPGFLSSMQEPSFSSYPSSGVRSDFTQHLSARSINTSEPFTLQPITENKQGFLVSRPLFMPPLSPRAITRTGASSVPFDISEDLQTYLHYSHRGGPSVAGPSTLRQSNPTLSSPGGQYDPLYDSIEPDSGAHEASKLFDFGRGEHIRTRVGVMESDTAPRLENVSPKHDGGKTIFGRFSEPQNVVENNRRNVEVDYAVEAAVDAEVGVVDNESPRLEEGRDWSPGHPLEAAAAGDVDQTHPNDNGRNIKEMRTMKIFRTALADFVKELLKPTWREGHMSKDSFKTIVKKAVDKVAGSLQSHQIPNTQERIDQYLTSSRIKLMKLVEGYVDKYGKA
eukprot:Gb_00875 [translate_table: standard]